MSKLISIITPVYNFERFIGQCINSVIDQSYWNWEMLIVDDCSTDRTPEICEEYAKKDLRIKLLPNRNRLGNYSYFLKVKNLFLPEPNRI